MTSCGVAIGLAWFEVVGRFDVMDALSTSGPVARLTLAILAVMSVATWATWGTRHFRLVALAKASREARSDFLRAQDTSTFEHRCAELPPGPVPRMFLAAHAEYRELASLASAGWSPMRAEAGRTVLQRTLETSRSIEMARARMGVGMLATIGATAPFVGLFGTVWGVIDAFAAIGGAHSADLAVVAPGIAEALVATAAGLLAAVPAVWGHNTILGVLRGLGLELEQFETAFLNVFDRSLTGPA